MGKKLFSYYDNAQSTHAQNLTLQQLLDKMGEELRTKVDNTEAVKDHDARQKLKLETLPAVAWMEQFADGAPHQAGTGKATGVVLTDHDGCNPDEVWKTVSEKMLSHWNDMDQIILGVHRTPSGEGIRILFRWLKGCKSIPECQAKMAEWLGLENDDCTSDSSRLSYLVDKNRWYYISYEGLEEDISRLVPENYKEEGKKWKREHRKKNARAQKQATTKHPAAESQPTTPSAQPLDYARKVFDLAVKEAGLTGVQLDADHFCHNNLMAVLSAGVCQIVERGALQQVIGERMPNYAGCDDCERLVDDFYRIYLEQNKPLTQRLRGIMAQAMKAVAQAEKMEKERASAEQEVAEMVAAVKPAAPLPVWPPIVREVARCFPPKYQPMVALTACVAVSVLMSRVVARYADNKLHHANLMLCVEGSQSGNKSFCKDAWEMLLGWLFEDDQKRRLIEADWERELRKKNGASVMTKDMPQLVVRTVTAAITTKKMLMRLQRALGLHLFCSCEEIDSLVKAQKSTWSEKGDLLRYSFDNGLAGCDTAFGSDSSIMVPVMMNSVWLGTPKAVSRFYKDCEDGLVSRTIFEILDDGFSQKWTADQKATPMPPRTRERLTRLLREMDSRYALMADGETLAPVTELKLDFLNKALEAWLEQQRLMAIKEADRARDTFRKRAAVNAFRLGMVAMVCHQMQSHTIGRKEREEVKRFVLWAADRILTNVLTKFGDSYNELIAQSESIPHQRRTKTVTLYESLPEEFTLADLHKAMAAQGVKQRDRGLLLAWQRADFIEECDKCRYRKVNQKKNNSKKTKKQ